MEYLETASGRVAIPDAVIAASQNTTFRAKHHTPKGKPASELEAVHVKRTLVEQYVAASPAQREQIEKDAVTSLEKQGRDVEPTDEEVAEPAVASALIDE